MNNPGQASLKDSGPIRNSLSTTNEAKGIHKQDQSNTIEADETSLNARLAEISGV
jgi:hypothetical protein